MKVVIIFISSLLVREGKNHQSKLSKKEAALFYNKSQVLSHISINDSVFLSLLIMFHVGSFVQSVEKCEAYWLWVYE